MLKLHNTLTRSKDEFKPLKPGSVGLYTCGPTVYGPAHIGNLRTYVFEDVLRRWLKYGHELEVTQVMNITDVEDKILRDSQAKTVAEMAAYTEPFTEKFHADLAALGVEVVEQYPRATQYIPQMIVLIEKIVAAGFGYKRDGSVYFDVRKYNDAHGYGKLLKIDFEGFSEHRIDNDEYEKDNIQDFALWKAESADSVGWDSPWGHGRPGWHIECSAMSAELLGQPFDIHTGGVDNIFPHHENEIAQSQAANGSDLARTWLHAEHLLVDGAKMAKSENNFYTLDDVREKGFDPLVLRMLYVSAHYRSKLNFSWKSLEAAKASLDRIGEFMLRLGEPVDAGAENPGQVADLLQGAKKRFVAAMDDDLNTPEALASVFDLMRELNQLLDNGNIESGEVEAIKDQFDFYDRVLGVVHGADVVVPAEIQELADARESARQAKNWAESDRLRDALAAQGWSVEDTSHGPRLRQSK